MNDCQWLATAGRGQGAVQGSSPKGKSKATAEEHQLRTRLIRRWLLWLFDTVVGPTIRAHFYVTETGIQRNRVFYYRKPMWRRLQALGVSLWQLRSFARLPNHVAKAALQSGASWQHVYSRCLLALGTGQRQ